MKSRLDLLRRLFVYHNIRINKINERMTNCRDKISPPQYLKLLLRALKQRIGNIGRKNQKKSLGTLNDRL